MSRWPMEKILARECFFTALSYTWGPPEEQLPIVCNGKILLVRPNLERALRSLRSQHESQSFWIDAICINQGSLEERKYQVQLMRSIYSVASRVFVWLGDDSEEGAEACRLIARIVAAGTKDTPETAREALSDGKLVERGLPPANSKEWRAFGTFCQRPWFQRVWIIQELALATEPTVHCGSHRMPWEHLESAAWYAQMHQIPVHGTVAVTELSIYRREYQRGQALTLLQLLNRSTASEATDPRDKVYGLLGICSDVEASDLEPDYEIAPADLFRKTALLYLGRGNLHILSSVSDPRWRLTEGLPSWAPDWPFRRPAWQLADGSRAHAGSARPARCRVQGDGSTIVVSGMTVDSVRTTGYWMTLAYSNMLAGPAMERIASRDVLVRMRRLCLTQWRRLALGLGSYPTGEDLDAAFYRTIVADSSPAWPSAGPQQRLSMAAMFESFASGRTGAVFGSARFDPVQESTEDQRRDEKLMRSLALSSYTMAFFNASSERRFFITANGFMGIGPRSTRPGDSICVLWGAPSPLVVREGKKGQSSIVGECYVHGAMQHEARMDREQAEDIVLA